MSAHFKFWVGGVVTFAVGCSSPTVLDPASDSAVTDTTAASDGVAGDSTLTDTGGPPGDTATSDTTPGDGAGGGKWTTISTTGATPTGAGGFIAVGLPTKIVTLNDGPTATTSFTFDGGAWSSVTVPTSLKGTGCAGAVGFGGGALVYSGCPFFASSTEQTWVFDGSTWSEKTAGGQGRGYGAMARANDPNKVFMTGGEKPSGSGKLDWLASWTLAGGWKVETAPSTLLGTAGYPDSSFTIFNLGDNAYAIDSASKTRKWNGTDWAEVTGASTAPKPTSGVGWSGRSTSFATDGKQTLLLHQWATYSWDAKNWTLISADPACEGGRNPKAIANIGSRFFLFCLPSAGDTTPWLVKEWK